jgi:NAD(P) transhydrogenase
MADTFDLVVIGAGPAGESAATTAALLGKRVAVIERAGHVGGAAVNTGTVPSKTLRETAVALSGHRSRELYGVDLSLRRGATVADFLRHERAVRHAERGQILGRLDRLGVTVVHGAAAFADPHTLAVTGPAGTRHVRGEAVIVAIGSVPARPPGFPFEHPCVHDSDELLDLHELPRSLAVVGAGVIGAEYAGMFAALGVRTYLIDGRDTLLPFLDGELSAALEAALTELGVRFEWGETVDGCEATPAGPVALAFKSGRGLVVDQVLVCAGRTSRTADLNPAAAGLEVADKGRLAVDACYRTNVPHVYAVGDVIGFPALASTSAEQGRAAAEVACGQQACGEVAPVLPTGIYTIPEVSAAGDTEAAVRKRGEPYLVGRARYADTPRGKIVGEKTGFLKLLFRADDRTLLGVHVIGEHASEVVHVGVLGLMTGATLDLYRRTCFNYPTLGELYKLAAHDAARRGTVAPPGG